MFARGVREAEARDDLAAIRDLGYERALAELRAGNADRAADLVGELRGELMRRDADVPAALHVVAASAHYQRGDLKESERTARRALDAATTDRLRGRVRYVLGMIAADRGDTDRLARAVGAAERTGIGGLADAARKRLDAVAADSAGSAFTESARP